MFLFSQETVKFILLHIIEKYIKLLFKTITVMHLLIKNIGSRIRMLSI